jgi:hypothetical protein
MQRILQVREMLVSFDVEVCEEIARRVETDGHTPVPTDHGADERHTTGPRLVRPWTHLC